MSAEKRCWRNCAARDSLLGVHNLTKTHEGFGRWFAERETELYSVDFDHEAAREVASARESVHPDLTFEFGRSAQKTEFVISAAGIKDAFPVVLALARLRLLWLAGRSFNSARAKGPLTA